MSRRNLYPRRLHCLPRACHMQPTLAGMSTIKTSKFWSLKDLETPYPPRGHVVRLKNYFQLSPPQETWKFNPPNPESIDTIFSGDFLANLWSTVWTELSSLPSTWTKIWCIDRSPPNNNRYSPYDCTTRTSSSVNREDLVTDSIQ